MGFALGAKLVKPESEVWLLWGDGSAGYSIAEFDTALRHGAPAIAVIGNDAAWSQIEREQVPILGDNVACELAYTPYEVVARGYGGDGTEVGGPASSGDVAAALQALRRKASAGTPVVLNALIGRTDFREGSISV
jgi:thiamine pyrophosphate-dependent acetolactate synthase large subunit-like protein